MHVIFRFHFKIDIEPTVCVVYYECFFVNSLPFPRNFRYAKFAFSDFLILIF
jgi:hypothetical protein